MELLDENEELLSEKVFQESSYKIGWKKRKKEESVILVKEDKMRAEVMKYEIFWKITSSLWGIIALHWKNF